jgi:predicted lipoprotein with Yx(FWY)xxD motif
MRKKTFALALAGAALTALALAGCSGGSGSAGGSGGSGSTGGGSATASSPSAGGAGSSSTAGDKLSTATTSLGKIVVDGTGMTVYYYGQDTKGETSSTCTGACASQWPAVTASGTPTVTGVTGTVGTIAGPNGTKQVTIDGLPIYTYAGDSKAGDVNGQLIGNAWWAVAPDGSKITTAAGGSSSGGY